MRYAPALPIFQLMPAVGSLMVPVATSLVAGLPENFLTPARYAAFSSASSGVVRASTAGVHPGFTPACWRARNGP